LKTKINYLDRKDIAPAGEKGQKDKINCDFTIIMITWLLSTMSCSCSSFIPLFIAKYLVNLNTLRSPFSTVEGANPSHILNIVPIFKKAATSTCPL
jgi:hypothetical protein